MMRTTRPLESICRDIKTYVSSIQKSQSNTISINTKSDSKAAEPAKDFFTEETHNLTQFLETVAFEEEKSALQSKNPTVNFNNLDAAVTTALNNSCVLLKKHAFNKYTGQGMQKKAGAITFTADVNFNNSSSFDFSIKCGVGTKGHALLHEFKRSLNLLHKPTSTPVSKVGSINARN